MVSWASWSFEGLGTWRVGELQYAIGGLRGTSLFLVTDTRDVTDKRDSHVTFASVSPALNRMLHWFKFCHENLAFAIILVWRSSLRLSRTCAFSIFYRKTCLFWSDGLQKFAVLAEFSYIKLTQDVERARGFWANSLVPGNRHIQAANASLWNASSRKEDDFVTDNIRVRCVGCLRCPMVFWLAVHTWHNWGKVG